ncbi:hypothetical protein CTheo_2837 [Ceratobasidium theobromae]|uniref:UBC core domain-containing protein n=1 Tax=Ceratobasidium theobromae TaxID=1582974 RepID=A0A5N5QRA3_9AGAM|nr:hypothetical protein CTheo_2837 [Ceratobasidium theobromae]
MSTSMPTPSVTPSGSKPGTPSGGPGGPQLLLRRQLMELKKHPVEGFSAGKLAHSTVTSSFNNICHRLTLQNEYKPIVAHRGALDLQTHFSTLTGFLREQGWLTRSFSEGGFFKARLEFPENFPLFPPVMKFITPMWHPNIYPDGKVCISILHPPGDDQYGYEQAGERWMPVHTVESILISVMSLLSSDTPNIDSPANVDAAVQVRDDIKGYRRKVRRLASESAELPAS